MNEIVVVKKQYLKVIENEIKILILQSEEDNIMNLCINIDNKNRVVVSVKNNLSGYLYKVCCDKREPIEEFNIVYDIIYNIKWFIVKILMDNNIFNLENLVKILVFRKCLYGYYWSGTYSYRTTNI